MKPRTTENRNHKIMDKYKNNKTQKEMLQCHTCKSVVRGLLFPLLSCAIFIIFAIFPAISLATVQCTCTYPIDMEDGQGSQIKDISISAKDKDDAEEVCREAALADLDEIGDGADADASDCKEADTAAPAGDTTGAGTAGAGTSGVGTTGECYTKGSSTERGLFTRGLADGCVGCGDCTKCDILKVVDNILRFALQIAGPLAILVIIIGGFLYITALGNDERIQAGKRAITAAVIGYIVVLVSWMIINFVINTLTGGTGESAKIFDKVWHSPDCGTISTNTTGIGTGTETGTEAGTETKTGTETKAGAESAPAENK